MDMAAFHRTMHQEPDETTPALVYADFLEEQGQAAAADALRRHVERTGNAPIQASYFPAGGGGETAIGPGEIQFGKAGLGRDGWVIVRQRSAADPSRVFRWHVGAHEDGLNLLRRADAEGANINHAGRLFLANNPPPRDTGGTEYGHQSMSRLARAYQRFRRR